MWTYVAALVASSSAFHLAPPRVTQQQTGRAGTVCAIDALYDFVISLLDPVTGKVLPCYMASSIEKQGATFAALSPANAPVSLAELDDERLVPVEDETEAMIAAAQAACEALQISLVDTPVVLTVSGPGLENIDLEDDDEDEDEEDGGVSGRNWNRARGRTPVLTA